jgi:hypothetical protein
MKIIKTDSDYRAEICCNQAEDAIAMATLYTNSYGSIVADMTGKRMKLHSYILRYCPFCGAKITKEWEDEDA